MAAYVIFDVEIRDMNKYQEFMKEVKPAIDAAGGKYLARGGVHKVYEGDWQRARISRTQTDSRCLQLSASCIGGRHSMSTKQAL